MSTDEMVVIFATNDVVDAQMYKAVLEEEKIPVFEQTLHLHTHIHHKPSGYPNYRLLVSKDDEPRSTELLEAYHKEVMAGNFALEDPDDEQVDVSRSSEDNSVQTFIRFLVIFLAFVALGLAVLGYGYGSVFDVVLIALFLAVLITIPFLRKRA